MKYSILCLYPGVGLAVRVSGLGPWGPEFESLYAVELTPGGADSDCHPSEVGEMSTSLQVITFWGNLCWSGDPSRTVLLANETASAALCVVTVKGMVLLL